MRIAPATLDPADATQPDSISRRNLTSLFFDTLATVDDFGRFQPALALSWQADPGYQRWQFRLRTGVKFDDGSPLTPDATAASLRMTNPRWIIYTAGDSLVIELEAPNPALLAELALPGNAIVKRSTGKLNGTGPFRVKDWQAGTKLVAVANEDYWGGRPYVDSIQFEFGKTPRDQLLALELGRVQVAEIAPEQAHRVAMENRSVGTSAPVELVALVFARDRVSADEAKLRDALALSIDRASIKSVLLQGGGEPAGGILPDWMTGYGFLFPTSANVQKARQERSELRQAPVLTLGYDPQDSLSHLIAERVALNARDAGIGLQTTSANNADLRLVRVSLSSSNPRVALTGLVASLGLPAPKFASDTAESLYQAESSLLQTQRLIPLFHLPMSYGLSTSVRGWAQKREGSWDLDGVWLSTEKP
jgi:peptide/nickel transport system substrate-binding protein